MSRYEKAKSYYNSCLEKLDKKYEPKQKYQIGDIVYISKEMPNCMRYFKKDFTGVVEYSYGQMYRGDKESYKSYSIYYTENGKDNSTSWYPEELLTKVNDEKNI